MFGTIAVSGGEFLLKLKDIETARGLITFVVAVAVMSIALVVAVYVMASTESKDEIKDRFGYAKDILATLVGIFGTVLGFYYASQNQVTEQPISAEFQIRSNQLIGHVTGSTPPYRYTIAFPGDDPRKLQQRVAKDGWIIETIPSSMKKDDAIQVEVTDAKDRKLSKSIKYAPEERTASTAADLTSTAPAAPPAVKPSPAPAEKPSPPPGSANSALPAAAPKASQ